MSRERGSMISVDPTLGMAPARLAAAARSACRRLLTLLLLACVVLQATAIETHVHPAPAPTVSSSAAGLPRAATPSRRDLALDCQLCREAAIAGAYLLPVAIVVPAPPTTDLTAAIESLRAFGLATPIFGWHSRAPPE